MSPSAVPCVACVFLRIKECWNKNQTVPVKCKHAKWMKQKKKRSFTSEVFDFSLIEPENNALWFIQIQVLHWPTSVLCLELFSFHAVSMWFLDSSSCWFFLLLALTLCLHVPLLRLCPGEKYSHSASHTIQKGSNTPFSFNGRHLICGSVATF